MAGKTRTNLQPVVQITFGLSAIALMFLFRKFPNNIDWDMILFLAIMVVFDHLNRKIFSGFTYSFNTVILGLIIFDQFSEVYAFFYILIDFLLIFKNSSRGILVNHIVSIYINMIVVLLCNEYYNNFTHQSYVARYCTLLMFLFLTVLLRYVYVFLETKKFTTKYFLDTFGPMMFELFLIFPVVSYFDHFNINLVLLLYLSYYTIIGYLHRKFMDIDLGKFEVFVKQIETRYHLKILFADLGEIKGVCYPDKQLIFIDEKIDFPEQLQTLVHESLHFQLKAKLKGFRLLEEVIVTLLEAIYSWYYIIKLDSDKEAGMKG